MIMSEFEFCQVAGEIARDKIIREMFFRTALALLYSIVNSSVNCLARARVFYSMSYQNQAMQ